MSDQIGTGQAGTYALLLDTLRAGRGLYNGGEGGIAGGPFASPGSNAVRLDRNAQTTEDQADCTRMMMGQQYSTILDAFNRNATSDGFQRVCTAITDSEFRQQDRQRDADRENRAEFRSIQDRLCSIEKQAAVDAGESKAAHAAIQATMAANKEIAELTGELIALKTREACGCTTGCSTPCNGHHGHH